MSDLIAQLAMGLNVNITGAFLGGGLQIEGGGVINTPETRAAAPATTRVVAVELTLSDDLADFVTATVEDSSRRGELQLLGALAGAR